MPAAMGSATGARRVWSCSKLLCDCWVEDGVLGPVCITAWMEWEGGTGRRASGFLKELGTVGFGLSFRVVFGLVFFAEWANNRMEVECSFLISFWHIVHTLMAFPNHCN